MKHVVFVFVLPTWERQKKNSLFRAWYGQWWWITLQCPQLKHGGRRDTLKLDDIIIFEFSIYDERHSLISTKRQEERGGSVACIIFIDYLLIKIRCEVLYNCELIHDDDDDRRRWRRTFISHEYLSNSYTTRVHRFVSFCSSWRRREKEHEQIDDTLLSRSISISLYIYINVHKRSSLVTPKFNREYFLLELRCLPIIVLIEKNFTQFLTFLRIV